MSWRDSVDDADASTRAFMDGFKPHLAEARKYICEQQKTKPSPTTTEPMPPGTWRPHSMAERPSPPPYTPIPTSYPTTGCNVD